MPRCTALVAALFLAATAPTGCRGESAGRAPICGDNQADDDEPCDGVDLRGGTCESHGFAGGTLACGADCRFDTSGCALPVCGDGVAEWEEECDGFDLAGSTCESTGHEPGMLLCDAECRPDPTGCLGGVCAPRTLNHPFGWSPAQTWAHPRADLQLAVAYDAAVQDVLPGGGPEEAAVAVDKLGVDQWTAGLVVSRNAVTGTVADEIDSIGQAITDTLGPSGLGLIDSLTIFSAGNAVVSHDGYDTVVSTVFRISSLAVLDIGDLRHRLFEALLGRPLSSFVTPVPLRRHGTEFLFSFTTQWRGDGTIAVIGAVALADDHDSIDAIRLRVADLANASGLARSEAEIEFHCGMESVSEGPKTDIIWVIDESGSMWVHQQGVADGAVEFFNVAAGYGADFRMAWSG